MNCGLEWAQCECNSKFLCTCCLEGTNFRAQRYFVVGLFLMQPTATASNHCAFEIGHRLLTACRATAMAQTSGISSDAEINPLAGVRSYRAAPWPRVCSIGTLQLSIRCSSFHFSLSRSLPVSSCSSRRWRNCAHRLTGIGLANHLGIDIDGSQRGGRQGHCEQRAAMRRV